MLDCSIIIRSYNKERHSGRLLVGITSELGHLLLSTEGMHITTYAMQPMNWPASGL